MEALDLKSQGLPHWEMAQLVQVSQNTLRSYLKDYQAGGIAGLKVLTFYQPQSELKPHQATLEAQFRAHPPQSLAQAAAKIEALTGIRRSR
ncbi:MAG: IS630 family transposase, partial [Phormidesmis priestleyi]